MSLEALRTVVFENQDGKAEILLQSDGRPYRDSVVGQLGKRFFCGQEVTLTGVGKPTTVRVTGPTVISGESIQFGCGTEVLYTKSPNTSLEGATGIPKCCDLPMSLQVPKLLPSSD